MGRQRREIMHTCRGSDGGARVRQRAGSVRKDNPMKLASCCEAELSGSLRRSPTVTQRCAAAAGWVVPGAILAVLPKCPACVAGYLAIAGIGVSMTTASY